MRGTRRFALSLLCGALMINCCGCASSKKSRTVKAGYDKDDPQTVTVEDKDYYTRFKGQNKSINVYNWGEYVADGSEEGMLDTNKEFEELTGIKINYTNFATNEELYAKLKGGAASYDVIIPSDYMISRLIKEGLLRKVDMQNIPNSKYIMDSFKGLEYDPEDEYSVAYTWGTVGIIYNKDLVGIEEEDIDWDILWNEDYKDQILMFDNPRDAFAIAELILGYSINTEDPDELRAAAAKLTEQKPLVQGYVMDEIFDKMGGGEALLAPYYAGDALMIMDDNEDLTFAVPKSGTNLFVDAMCIPSSSREPELAEMYINFMCEPDVAYANIDYIKYSTPHSAAYEMLDDEVKNSKISYPDDKFIKEKTTVFTNLTPEAAKQMQDLWTEMKSAEDKNSNRWFVPLFLIICFAIIIVVLIRRHIKAKRDIF